MAYYLQGHRHATGRKQNVTTVWDYQLHVYVIVFVIVYDYNCKLEHKGKITMKIYM